MYHPRFKGKHYEIGLKLGSLLKKNGKDFLEITKLNDFQLQYGVESEKVLKQFYPQACDEIKGIADGLSIHYKRFSAWLLCVSVCFEFQGCSMLALKKDGNTIFGRNNDLPPIFRKLSNSTYYIPENGYSFIANSSAFVSAEDGINEKGLAVGMTYVWAKKLKPGFNSMFFVRYILENCATAEEALNAIQNIPIGSAYHLLMADKDNIIHVECSPEKIKINRNDIAFATNHFISDELKEFEESKNLYFSYERYATGNSELKNCVKEVNVEYVKDILSGKFGFMCQYQRNTNFDTVWSSIFDIVNHKIMRAEGNPSRIQFKEDLRLNKVFA